MHIVFTDLYWKMPFLVAYLLLSAHNMLNTIAWHFVQCTTYSVKYTTHSVKCTTHSVQCQHPGKADQTVECARHTSQPSAVIMISFLTHILATISLCSEIPPGRLTFLDQREAQSILLVSQNRGIKSGHRGIKADASKAELVSLCWLPDKRWGRSAIFLPPHLFPFCLGAKCGVGAWRCLLIEIARPQSFRPK